MTHGGGLARQQGSSAHSCTGNPLLQRGGTSTKAGGEGGVAAKHKQAAHCFDHDRAEVKRAAVLSTPLYRRHGNSGAKTWPLAIRVRVVPSCVARLTPSRQANSTGSAPCNNLLSGLVRAWAYESRLCLRSKEKEKGRPATSA